MSKQFWVLRGDEKEGPLTPEEIWQLENYEEFQYRLETGDEWKSIEAFDELTSSQPAPPGKSNNKPSKPDPPSPEELSNTKTYSDNEPSSPKPDAPDEEEVLKAKQEPQDDQELSTKHLIDATRRNVTVVFSEVQGLAKINETMGAEKGREISNDLFDQIVPAVKQFGGEIDKYMGEKVMALFGARETHPDDPKRAVQAGLEIVDTVDSFGEDRDFELDVKVGINTGRVVAGKVGAKGEEDFSVMGQGVNLAARLTSKADLNTVLIGSETERRLKGPFKRETVSDIDLKGMEDPVTAYEITGTRNIVEDPTDLEEDREESGGRGRRMFFISRDRELEQLEGLLTSDNKVYDPEGKKNPTGLVLGEAGLGKTRLLTHFLKNKLHDDVPVLFTQGNPYSEGLPFNTVLPFIDYVLDIEDPSHRPRNESELEQMLPDEWAHMSEEISLVYGLAQEETAEQLIDEDTGELPAEEAFETGDAEFGQELEERRQVISGEFTSRLADFLLDSLGQSGVVLELDDAQWSDEASLTLIRELITRQINHERSILILIDSRPVGIYGEQDPEEEIPAGADDESRTKDRSIEEDIQTSSDLPGVVFDHLSGKFNHLEIVELQPLSLHEIRQFLSKNLPGAQIPDQFVDNVQDRSGGVPLHLEQMLWSLIDRGSIHKDSGEWEITDKALDVSVPSTLTDLIVGRIDELPENVREVLLVSSVLGIQFERWILDEIIDAPPGEIDDAIALLLERGFLRSREGEIIFQHTTIQEVSYGLLLEKDRKQFHSDAADALLKGGTPADSDSRERIAGHLEGAERYEELIRLRINGAEQAMASYSYDDARRIVREIDELEWSEELGNEWLARFTVLKGRLARRNRKLEKAIEHHEEALRIYRSIGEARRQARQHATLGKVTLERSLEQESRDHYDRVMELSEQFETPYFESVAYWGKARIEKRNNEWEEAQELTEKALEIDRELDNKHGQVVRLGTLGGIAEQKGDIDQAIEYNRQALEIIRQLNDDRGEAFHLGTLGRLAEKKGRLEVALDYVQRAMEMNREVQNKRGIIIQYHALGRIAKKKGNLDEAEDHIETALEMEENHPNEKDRAILLGAMGRIQEEKGNLDEAFDYFRDALEMDKERNDERGQAIQLGFLGKVTRKQGRYDEAEEYAKKALKLSRRRNHTLSESIQLNSLGKIAQKQGRIEDAREYFRKAAEASEQIDDKRGQARHYGRLAEISQKLGYIDDALKTRKKVLELQSQADDNKSMGRTLISMARLQMEKGDHMQAMDSVSRAFEHTKKAGDDIGSIKVMLTRARLAEKKERYQEALEQGQNAVEQSRELNYLNGMYSGWINQAMVHSIQSNDEQAEEALQNAADVYDIDFDLLKNNERRDLYSNEVRLGINRARCLYQLGREAEAETQAESMHEQALQGDKDMDNLENIVTARKLLERIRGNKPPSTEDVIKEIKQDGEHGSEQLQVRLKPDTLLGKIKRFGERILGGLVQERPEHERKLAEVDPVEGPGYRAEFNIGDRGVSLIVKIDASYDDVEQLKENVEYPTGSVFAISDTSPYKHGFYVQTGEKQALKQMEQVLSNRVPP
ncbi:MAG: tetratricopeptide repeat protein [bacterium]